MPRFRVLVTRDTTEHCLLIVDADSKSDAADEACWKARMESQWQPDDGACSDPYVADEDECVTLVPDADPWVEDPDYPFADWQHEVANLDTTLGYRDWIAHQREIAEDERREWEPTQPYATYDAIPTDVFDAKVQEIALAQAPTDLFTIPGVWEILSEHYNNAALDALCPFPRSNDGHDGTETGD